MNVKTYICISKYFRIILISIILNVHNDPCFEDKSSSLTLRYRPVHFFENSCSLVDSIVKYRLILYDFYIR